MEIDSSYDRLIGKLLGGDNEGYWVRISQQGPNIWLLQYADPHYEADSKPWDPLRFGDMGFRTDELAEYLSEVGVQWLDRCDASAVYERFFAEIPD